MNDLKVLRRTGACGVAAGTLLLVASPIYLVMGTPPSLGNEALFAAYVTRSHTIAIVTKLVDIVYLVGFIVFAAGMRHLILRVRPVDGWLAALVRRPASWYSMPSPAGPPHCLTQNLTRGFAQLAASRISWWSISRKLARVMVPGSLPLAIAPQRFPSRVSSDFPHPSM